MNPNNNNLILRLKLKTGSAIVLLHGEILLCAFVLLLHSALSREDTSSAFWMKLGRAEIESALDNERNNGVAKNVILFVGDGMGMATVTAGRIYKGQQSGHPGEEGFLSFEKFKNVGLLKTYNVDRQVPDSAGTATAIFTGVKANYYTVGLDGTSTFNVCRSDAEATAKIDGLMSWGIKAGKSTGFVTTTRVTHATPAAAFAHSTNRDWECDTAIPEGEQGKGCKDIGRQLVEEEPGKNINVFMGGGEQTLRARVTRNESTLCFRGDNADLISDWMKYQTSEKRKFEYVSDRNGLLGVKKNTDYLLGIFGPGNLPFDKDRTVEPSIEEMTAKAIEILSRNSKGYVLIVEGGRIDHAHHYNLAQIAMEEVVAFDKAIKKAMDMTDSKETLIIVTADHSHAFAMVGYPLRGNPIAGLGDTTPEGYHYQTLSYINGPGYTHHRLQQPPNNAVNGSSTINTWKNLTKEDQERKIPHMAGYWTDYESHGGEDVPVYASGPMAHLFHGVHEQTHVAFSIAYSACIGPYENKCRNDNRESSHSRSSPWTKPVSIIYVLLIPILVSQF